MVKKPKLRNLVKLACLAAALGIFAVSCMKREDPEKKLTITGTNTYTPPAGGVEVSRKTDYSKFSHEVPEHAAINCDSCHQREAGSPALKFPGHDSCMACHTGEFASDGTLMCSICHSDVKSLPAGVKAFPVRFNEGFDMKFDHAAHSSGDALPPQGCASCHAPAGAGRTIPAGIGAHSSCYTCHTPESKIGSCNTCHTIAPYSRTVASRATFAAFRHSDHTARVSCAECHNTRPGAPQGRQVGSPAAVQHFSSAETVSCRTCHNDRRAFGEADFSNCKRCHTGPGFDMLP
jgi:c(7)-type cytochrome triheme protein